MKKIILFAAILAFLAGAAVISYQSQNKNEPVSDNKTNTGSLQQTAESTTVSEVSVPKKTAEYHGQALDFLGEPAVLAKYPPEYVASKREQLASVIGLIKENPSAIVNWMDLGLIKKNFDNFTGSRDAWEYVAALNPKDALNYYNLGNLYSAYLHDLAKAEQAYLTALNLDHSSENNFLALADFYRDFLPKQSYKAEEVLLKGLKQLPTSQNITLDLAFYYKNKGDPANAIKYFEYFLRLPNVTDSQRQQVSDEITKLKQ